LTAMMREGRMAPGVGASSCIRGWRRCSASRKRRMLDPCGFIAVKLRLVQRSAVEYGTANPVGVGFLSLIGR